MTLDLSMVRVGACPLLVSFPTTHLDCRVSFVKVNVVFPSELVFSTLLRSILMGIGSARLRVDRKDCIGPSSRRVPILKEQNVFIRIEFSIINILNIIYSKVYMAKTFLT